MSELDKFRDDREINPFDTDDADGAECVAEVLSPEQIIALEILDSIQPSDEAETREDAMEWALVGKPCVASKKLLYEEAEKRAKSAKELWLIKLHINKERYIRIMAMHRSTYQDTTTILANMNAKLDAWKRSK